MTILLQSATIITKCDSRCVRPSISKCDSLFYYKVRWSVITKCDNCYYKVRWVLQSATGRSGKKLVEMEIPLFVKLALWIMGIPLFIELKLFLIPNCSSTSLRSRHLEVVVERENGHARGRHARGEVASCVSFSRARFFLCPLLPSSCHAGYSSTRTKTMPDRVYFYSRSRTVISVRLF